ncbi:MAG: site-2 protease family protein [Dehalococcoidia bacterium]|nr:site-2 protease family protein [Dehalococcoidia bacterium]
MVATAVGLLTAVTVHEASHAFTARWQGDGLACGLGRCTLNPIRHLDPVGTVMMLVVGFGWGKPVPVRENWLRSGPRTGGALVSLAGPASNFAFAAVASLPLRFDVLPVRLSVPVGMDPLQLAGYLLATIVLLNILLGVFNLLPIAPLDGFKVALGILPRQAAVNFARLEPYGPGILMLLLMVGYLNFAPFGLGDLLNPVVTFVMRTLVIGP